MPHIGVDLEQFVADPYASGIQRVLQQLAIYWPSEEVSAEFIIPHRDEFMLLSPVQAADLVGLAFDNTDPGQLRAAVGRRVEELADTCLRARLGTILSMFSSWLLPEVSYLPSVIERLELFARTTPTAMIGYDALPMTDPANYRFKPGSAGQVSAYFRNLATVDSVACISEYSRSVIYNRLRRDRGLRTTVAHPGGDHLSTRPESPARSSEDPVTFLRLGTLEARKMPVEIARAFREARDVGADARLVFVGNPSSSDPSINAAIAEAVEADNAVQWVQGASDHEVEDIVAQSDVFLALGTEGFGIPVLEAIRNRVPVLYGGIQPAAELMAGRGATAIADLSQEGLATGFSRYSSPHAIKELTGQLDPAAVPRWSDFAMQVARDSVG